MRFSCLCRSLLLLLLALIGTLCQAGPPDGNRLAYLEGNDPYYVGLTFPKLTTPQWVGEDGVEAVVVLAIDDLRDNAPRYEAYLRPILDRLKAIDGRAGLSVMTCRIDPSDPTVGRWLKEGVNLDVHTLAHPCPLLQKDDFAAARDTVHGGVDLLNRVQGNRPVAFRMPCCDSLNTPSPRFYAEIFNQTSPGGHFLSIDSSVFQVLTPADPSLPRPLVEDPDGRERFRKYLPFPSFVNTIENYPYPYVLGKLCWEFPCIVPSDWEAQHLQKPNNPRTVDDLKAALDAVVRKQGVFDLVFHPHGWIKPEQVVELIDHAVARHGKKVKFLSFREAQERLDRNLLGGHPLRRAENGGDNGVRLLDLDADGYLDVVVGNPRERTTRLWEPARRRWTTTSFPREMVGVRFGTVGPGAATLMIARDERGADAWVFRDGRWAKPEAPASLDGLELAGQSVLTAEQGRDRGVRLLDLNHDGTSEVIVANESQNAVFSWDAAARRWSRLPQALPGTARLVDGEGRDAGLRFVDLDEDGNLDVVSSNDSGFSISLFGPKTGPGLFTERVEPGNIGWSRSVAAGRPDDPEALPKIVSAGKNSGMWVHSRHLWWQNETTARLPDLVDRRAFNGLLEQVDPRGKSPEASRRSIRVPAGFRVELAAAEPLVKDPIAFDWGADGRLWVVEMGDYPLGTDGKGKPGGVVRILEDGNGDGRYDRSTDFLDGLGFPTGLLPWRKGVLIACAPEIFYAEDRDGDGKADHREVLFTGFREGNQQHRLNGFELGLDGWVYGANGDSGGLVRSLRTGAEVNLNGRDFRFRPDEGILEAESGQTQFGRHRDDWGHWFGNNNPNWVWQFVLSDEDLRRNPQFAVRDTREMLEPDNVLYPISRTVARFNDPHTANRVTSANSPTPYRDDLFGPHFASSLFVSEPVHNLVHRVVLEPHGATFAGRRGPDESGREFLASSDNWTRPTMLRTGPDGALWVSDMYRAVIEHPQWIPDDWEAKLDLRAGSEQGRIYRVVPVDRPARPIPRLDRLEMAGLVAALESPSGWQRDTAQRLLMHRGDRSAAGPLRDLAASSGRPQVRVQALWTLKTLGLLTVEPVVAALADGHPQVRRNAVKAGAALLASSSALGEAMLRLAGDPDPEVRFQLALALGDWRDERAGRVLAGLVRRDPDDRWLRAAVLSSAASHVGTILAALFADAKSEAPPAAILDPLFALAAASKDRAGLPSLVAVVARPAGPGGRFAAWQFSALASLLDASARARQPLAPADRMRLEPLQAAARAVAAEAGAPEPERLAAVRLLGRERPHEARDLEILAGLLKPQVSAELQQAAVAALGRSGSPKVPPLLLDGWKGDSPQLRSTILDTLLSRDAWTGALLFSLEDTCVPPGEIDPAHRRRLLSLRSPEFRKRAEAVFSRETGSRHEVIATYRAAMTSAGDPAAGAVTFKRVCAACHRLGNEGAEVGPDLAALTDKSPESLLIAILDPNRAFEAKYANFTVQTVDGRVLTGLIAGETANTVTLRRQEGKEDVLLRTDIEAMAGSGQSLMPEGLEKDLKPQDVADLIAFLGTKGPPPRKVAGNHPERVRAQADGTLVLRARTAELYGDTLTFESRHENLGYWGRPSDRAAWQFVADRPGRYAVWIDWACDDQVAGNTLLVEVGAQRLEHRVAGTGGWDTYRQAPIGEVTLKPGDNRLEMHSAGPVRGAVMDLRSVELRPLEPQAGTPPKPAGSCCEP